MYIFNFTAHTFLTWNAGYMSDPQEGCCLSDRAMVRKRHYLSDYALLAPMRCTTSSCLPCSCLHPREERTERAESVLNYWSPGANSVDMFLTPYFRLNSRRVEWKYKSKNHRYLLCFEPDKMLKDSEAHTGVAALLWGLESLTHTHMMIT